jgi:beta-galactosidase
MIPILERFNKSCSLDWKSVGSFREVLDCGSPLPLWGADAAVKKRQRAAAVQDAGARFDRPNFFGGYGIFETALLIENSGNKIASRHGVAQIRGMKIRCSSAVRLLTLAVAVLTLNLLAADSPREHLSLDAHWKFHLGDDWPNALRLDKAGIGGGPASEKFDDAAWRSLDLPHDWAIELPFDKNADSNHGFKPVGPGFAKNNTGWYRRTFELSKEDDGKRIWLTFDGAFRDTTVWVNGWLVKRHESGYSPFREDITDIVRFGGRNTVAVKVDASKFEGWFYEGAGIYRHVWLDKTAPVAIAPDGVFVSSRPPNGCTVVEIQAQIQNTKNVETYEDNNVYVNFEVIDPSGKSVGEFRQHIGQPLGKDTFGRDNFELKANSQQQVKAYFNFYPPNRPIRMPSPTPGNQTKDVFATTELWSPESPKLYKLITTVEIMGGGALMENGVLDRQETVFGIRTVAFDKDQGFLLNGKHYELYGTCNHQDMAGVGAALPDALQYFRIAKLKEFGCNAYRTSHNPPTPELLDACDRLGMIVMDESRLLGSDSENLRRWEDQIRRDRNHASVGIWSVCNEEPREFSPDGGRVGATMQRVVQQLDPTRPVTAAEDVGDDYSGLMGSLEVRGWNYHVGQGMDDYHAKHPSQPNVGTEQASTVCTRGIYKDDAQRGYVSAYDARGTQTAERWWSYFADRPWLSGGFVWTGFDYRGEPVPYSWPCVNSHFGILDTCGFPKDNFYYYQAWWTTNPVLHLLPHWNWAGREGQEIRVDALSNCGEVELFLNGESLGKQAMKRNSKLSWKVKYAAGTLSAKGFNDGNVVAETKVETTGEPAAIQLVPDRATIRADGEDVSVLTVAVTDAQGRVVPTAGNKINFDLDGAGKILGVGNGDPSCHEPDTFIVPSPVKSVPVYDWRWKLAPVAGTGTPASEYAADFDDSTWNKLRKAGGDYEGQVLREGQTAIFRAHVSLTEADLANPEIHVRFAGIDDHGWIFVNDQRVGESSDWAVSPAFDIKRHLHAGDNVIAVDVLNAAGNGGLNPDVNVELVGRPLSSAWSRSAFNGLAQVIVQSAKEAGEIKLTASADGLKSATVSVQTQTCAPRPAMP